MKLIFVISFCVVAFFIFYGVNRIFLDFDEIDISNIENMIKEKKYDDCVEYINSKISKYPNNGLLYYNMAKVLFLKQDYKNALEYIDSSIQLGFPIVQSYNLKAIIYGDGLKDYNMQKEFSQKAVETDPTDFEGYVIKGRAWFNLGNYEDALRDFDTAFEIEKDDDLLLEKSVVLLQLKRFEEAIIILYGLNNKYPDNSSILYDLYLAYKGLGYYNNSLYIISKLYETQKNPFYLKEKSFLLFEMGDYEGSLVEFSNYINQSKLSPQDYEFYSKILKKQVLLKLR